MWKLTGNREMADNSGRTGLAGPNEQKSQTPQVDLELIAMFLKMTPEERLKSNDNAINTIAELKRAFEKQKTSNRRPERAS